MCRMVCACLTAVSLAQGHAVANLPDRLPPLPYLESVGAGSTVVLEVVPPQGELPGIIVGIDIATGKRLWRVREYSPALRLYAGGERFVLFNISPGSGNQPDPPWAIAFYHRGDEIKRHSLDAIVKVVKSPLEALTPKNSRPLGWLLRVGGPSEDGTELVVTLANGTELPMDARTGEIGTPRPGKQGDAKPETALAGSYLAALNARSVCASLNTFAVKLHNLVAKDGPQINMVVSPYGLATALAATATVADPEASKAIASLLMGKEAETPVDLLRPLHGVAAGTIRWSAGRLGVEFEAAKQGETGVVIKGLASSSPLKGHVAPGDRLLAVGGKPVTTLERLGDFLNGWAGELDVIVASGPERRHLFLPAVPGLPQVRLRTTLWTLKASRLGKVLEEKAAKVPEMVLGELPADAKEATAGVNREIAAETNEKTTGVVNPDDFSEDNALLTNTLYFAGEWATAFKGSETDPQGTFHLDDTRTVRVPVMKTTRAMAYWQAKDNTWVAVELLCKGGKYSLVIVLPRKTTGLGEVEELLAREGTQALFDRLDAGARWVHLELPRLKLSSTPPLEKPLNALGLPKLLRAPKGAAPGFLAIKNVRQHVALSVDEKGVEAAATTAVTVVPIGVPPNPITVSVEHPFLFLARDRSSNAILFVGRVTNPAER
jgi:serine protease inhibitor